MICVCAGCGLDQPVLDRRAPSPTMSDKLAICDPIPYNLMDDALKPTSPMKIPSPDRADASALVFADDELCVDRQPMKTHVRGGSPPQAMSPDKCRMERATPPVQPPGIPECKRFHVPHCRTEIEECPPLYDEFTQPPTETCEGYLTKPMRLPPLRTEFDVQAKKDALFAI